MINVKTNPFFLSQAQVFPEKAQLLKISGCGLFKIMSLNKFVLCSSQYIKMIVG